MKLRRSLAVPLVTALAVGLSAPALATGAFAADGDTTVPIRTIDASGADDGTAFDLAWRSTSPVLFTGESHDGGTVALADGGARFTTTSTTSQAFGLVPVHVALADVAGTPSLTSSGSPVGLQLRGDADGDGTYDADDYFTLVGVGSDEWVLSHASGANAVAKDPGAGHHSLDEWKTALGAASVQDVGVSLGSGSEPGTATVSSLSFDGTTYTFPGPQDFATTTVKVAGTVAVGSKVTADVSGWTPAPQVAFQWNLDGNAISGATSASYTPTATDKGHALSVTVKGALAGYNDASVTTTAATVASGTLVAPVPTVTGTARVGATLTAHAGTWTAGVTRTYQWKRNGVSIAGATKTTYLLAGADRGAKVTVTVTGKLAGYTDAVKTSLPTAAVGYASFTGAPTPTITGTVRVGNLVRASLGTWSPSATFTYRWKVNGVSISGATGSSYTPAAGYRGKKLTVTVTASRSGYTTVTRTSAAKTIGYGVLSAPAPRITGVHQTGHTLTAVAGTWKPSAHLTYRWKRNGVSIKGATHTTYKTTSADRGKKITVTVTGSRTGYTTRSRTSASVYVTARFAHTYAPTITGTTRVYSTLTAHVHAWSPTASFSYRWNRDGKAISGATHSTYKLAAADYHHRITVTVTGRRGTYTTTTRTSATTAVIYAPKGYTVPKVTHQPTSVWATSGTTATFKVSATGGGLHYQWQYSSDGKSWHYVSGATSSTLHVAVTSAKNERRYRAVVSNLVSRAISSFAWLDVQSTTRDPFPAGGVAYMYNWAISLGTTYLASSDGQHAQLEADGTLCNLSTHARRPAGEVTLTFVGSDSVRYGDALHSSDAVDRPGTVAAGACISFMARATVPVDLEDGYWRASDLSLGDAYYPLVQYFRTY